MRYLLLISSDENEAATAMADVGAAMLREVGLNLDEQAMDWGSVVQRRAKKEPVAQGGWSAFCTFTTAASAFVVQLPMLTMW